VDKGRQHIVIGLVLVTPLRRLPAKFITGGSAILVVFGRLPAGGSQQLLTAARRWGHAGDTWLQRPVDRFPQVVIQF
jgi:hypothetical protein